MADRHDLLGIEPVASDPSSARSPAPSSYQSALSDGASSLAASDGTRDDGERPSPLAAPAPPQKEEEEDPDPFLHDSEDEDEEEEEEKPSASASPLPPNQEIAIDTPSPPLPPAASSSSSLRPNAEKDVPPPPPPKSNVQPEDTLDSSSSSSEDETPSLYLPALVLPTMFLPIPNTDPLSNLLAKYIPPEHRPQRDLTGDWQRSDFNALVMTHSWRALARMARDRIVSTNPEEIVLILSLWYLRLSSLARLRLFNQTSAELANLFAVLHSPGVDRAELARVLPFELEVLHARAAYWAGDHMGYLDALHALLRKCKVQGRAGELGGRKRRVDEATREMWRERGARVCLIIASQLAEMKDFVAATRVLEPLCAQAGGSAALRSAVGRVYLQAGHLARAGAQFAAVAADPRADAATVRINEALFACAEGDWGRAAAVLRDAVKEDPDNYVAVNDLAVALLGQGRVAEGVEVLESALRASPSAVTVAEPFLFNLSTLYELRSATAAAKKRQLLVEVAKWSGDGLRTACLKMPAN
ncbi:hypothetical protein PUNSTDRAFT_106100 [Punctularia strigosozonata HHB-11173 SS5]|uniref:uncharacterized protein n=1 Tax=Punctularia strigosozonata (strain HHB-11173) TaxID=741275 RepID=UPI00044164A3|nr:uncharacterized protein PUNSTDRAFT_106100 [Punctularia strigosozonata HHB-11173 SS5]EIN05971.1 hypothetical protein PUNSTDRAFT_106100 [Punctularia strigosozonata HHB-11173 SS5]